MPSLFWITSPIFHRQGSIQSCHLAQYSPQSVETVECARVATGQPEISLFTKHIEMAGRKKRGRDRKEGEESVHHHVANLPHCTAAGKGRWQGPLVGRAQEISLQWARRMNQSFSSCDRWRKSLRGTQCLGYSCLLRTQLPLNSGKTSTVYNKVSPFLRLI